MTTAFMPLLAGQDAPTSEMADGANVGQVEEHTRTASADLQGAPHAAQALLVIEGEQYARAYLDRVRDGMAQPGELAVILAFLTGEMLAGACRVIEKCLGGRHA